MAERVQTYKNHGRLLPPYHLFVLPVLLIYVLNQIRHLWLEPSRSTAFAVVVALALLTLALYTRVMTLKVQDRVIRLEMRLRLAQVLPPDLHARIADLTAGQLVALRFASDAELPGLVRDVLDGRLTTSKAIKLKVKDWQADWLRA
jgi:Family of unknown function (DUF6526)